MGYFQCLCFILGAYILVAGLWIVVTPEGYRTLAKRMMPEKRPGWFTTIGGMWMLFVLWTWWKFLEVQTGPALIVTLILSLSLIKIFAVLFNYGGFRNFAGQFLECPNAILRTIAALYISIGAVFIALGMAW